MKKVKMVCPTNAPIWVTEEHAKRILAMPQNKTAKWKIDQADQEKKQNATTVDDHANKGASKEASKPGKARKSGKPGRQA